MTLPYGGATLCYAVVCGGTIAFGLTYLFRGRFMGYHEEALRQPWGALDDALQALLIGLMRAIGGGLIGAGIGEAVVLTIPFRNGEEWSRLALPAIGLATLIPALYANILIRVKTGARTPALASLTGIALIILGFVLSVT